VLNLSQREIQMRAAMQIRRQTGDQRRIEGQVGHEMAVA